MCTKYIDIVCVLYNVHIYEIFFKFFKYFIARELNKYFCPTLLNLSPWGGGCICLALIALYPHAALMEI